MEKFSDLDHESRFEAILSSVNTEFKSVTLGFCLDKYWNSCVDLRDSYYSFVEGSNVRIPNTNATFSDYCHLTFFPIGLVVEEKIEKKEPFRYATSWKLTEDGLAYGKPSAALAIKTTNDFGMSLYSVLGYTGSSGDSRSPYNRAKILMKLDKTKEARAIDLSNSLKLCEHGISYHCKNLSQIGFIEYESINTEERGWSKYKWIKGKKLENVKVVNKYTNLTLEVAKTMEENPKAWDHNELAEKIESKYAGNISSILSGLEKQRFVKRAGKFKGGEKHSEAKIAERGRRFVNDFLNPVHEALDPNADETVLEEFEETYQYYLDNPDLLRSHIISATGLYSDVSPRLRSRPRSLTQRRIVSLIKKKGRLRPREIAKILGKSKVSSDYLTPLVKKGKLKKERKGMAVYYSLV